MWETLGSVLQVAEICRALLWFYKATHVFVACDNVRVEPGYPAKVWIGSEAFVVKRQEEVRLEGSYDAYVVWVRVVYDTEGNRLSRFNPTHWKAVRAVRNARRV